MLSSTAPEVWKHTLGTGMSDSLATHWYDAQRQPSIAVMHNDEPGGSIKRGCGLSACSALGVARVCISSAGRGSRGLFGSITVPFPLTCSGWAARQSSVSCRPCPSILPCTVLALNNTKVVVGTTRYCLCVNKHEPGICRASESYTWCYSHLRAMFACHLLRLVFLRSAGTCQQRMARRPAPHHAWEDAVLVSAQA